MKPVSRPKVDVVFVLDTTGSMGGLLEGAKRHIWAIASRIAGGQPRPDVRMGLVAYRDRGDTYVTRSFDLNGDIDDVYARLRTFRAGGGGDTKEHVNRALQVALDKMSWRQGQRVLRQIYLVGDAPPHEGRDGLRSTVLARRASRLGIVINAIRCGTLSGTERAWRTIASLGGGIYGSVRQDGGMLAVATPYDRRLAALNRALSGTLLPAGSGGLRHAARRRARANAAMGAAEQAASAAFRARSGKLDSGDLLGQLAKGRTLDSYKDHELPASLAALPKPAQRAYVRRVAKQRAELKAKVLTMTKKREAFLRKARRVSGAKTPAVDDVVERALRKQGKKAGILY